MRSYLRSLDPRLPRPVYVLELGALVNAFGNGVVLPFLLIYLHNVRGISFGLAGLAAAVQSAAALASAFLGGALSDRVGPKRVLLGSLAVMTVAFALMPTIRTVWEAFAIYTLWGIGSGAFWPSQSALLAGTDAVRATSARVRAAETRDERRRRGRRPRRRPDRIGRESADVHRPLRDQLRHVRRLHGRPRLGSRPGVARRTARRQLARGAARPGLHALHPPQRRVHDGWDLARRRAAARVRQERRRRQREGGRHRVRARRARRG